MVLRDNLGSKDTKGNVNDHDYLAAGGGCVKRAVGLIFLPHMFEQTKRNRQRCSGSMLASRIRLDPSSLISSNEPPEFDNRSDGNASELLPVLLCWRSRFF